MIMELPEEFSKVYDNGWYVIIRKGVLEIHGGCNFDELMIEMTYGIKGRRRCYYCHEPVLPHKITIDHVHPRDFGGVSIINNLEPTCSRCNSSKSNLNETEFKEWRTLSTKEQKDKFCKKVIGSKKGRKYDPNQKAGFDLPKSWVTMQKLDTVIKVTRIDNSNGRKYKRMMAFVQKHGKLPRPLVITKNNVLLNGESAYGVSKELGFKTVPVIMLENVMFYDQ